MVTQKKPKWQTILDKYEKLFGILLFGFTLLGWIISHTIEKTEHADEMKQLKIDMQDVKNQLKNTNDYMTQQAQLNGKILEFMDIQVQQNKDKK